VRSGARFFIAIALAAVLGGWLAYVSLGGTLQKYASPSELTADGSTYRLNGLVSPGAPGDAAGLAQSPSGLRFQVQDKKQPQQSVTVLYRGSVPDTFRAGREVVLTGRVTNGVFVAQRNSLITLCPSKFQAKPSGSSASAEGGAGSPASS
jgi:cytochrome c-type biogenesis protein CcmE